MFLHNYKLDFFHEGLEQLSLTLEGSSDESRMDIDLHKGFWFSKETEKNDIRLDNPL